MYLDFVTFKKCLVSNYQGLYDVWNTGYFDVGLIHTAEPIEFTEAVKPLCLPPKSFQITSALSTKLAGWGQTQKNNVRSELTLRHITLTLFDKNYCYKKYEITGGDAGIERQKFLPDMFTDQVICAGSNVSFEVFPLECVASKGRNR